MFSRDIICRTIQIEKFAGNLVDQVYWTDIRTFLKIFLDL